jgi:hypothetical protein
MVLAIRHPNGKMASSVQVFFSVRWRREFPRGLHWTLLWWLPSEPDKRNRENRVRTILSARGVVAATTADQSIHDPTGGISEAVGVSNATALLPTNDGNDRGVIEVAVANSEAKKL